MSSYFDQEKKREDTNHLHQDWNRNYHCRFYGYLKENERILQITQLTKFDNLDEMD